MNHQHLSTRDSNALVDVQDLCGNLSMVFSTSERQALVTATQLHIHHLIRELQRVYLNNLLDLLDRPHSLSTIIWRFRTITSLVVLSMETSIDFCNVLMTSSASSSSSSGDLSSPIARTIKPQPIGTQTFPACLPLALLLLSRVLGSRPWLFFFLHVHLARVSQNHLHTPLAGSRHVFHRRLW